MTSHRFILAAVAAAATLLLGGCAASTGGGAPVDPDGTTGPAAENADHGAVAGASEVAEPPLQLLSIDDAGSVGIHDLLAGTDTEIGELPGIVGTATDGRYVFAESVRADASDSDTHFPDIAGGTAGVHVIDSGVWTWDHVDHFHYYRAAPALLGEVAGEGPVAVSGGPLATAGGTALAFAGSREAVLLDNHALSQGELVETLRLPLDGAPGDPLVAAPIGEGMVVSSATGDDGELRFVGPDEPGSDDAGSDDAGSDDAGSDDAGSGGADAESAEAEGAGSRGTAAPCAAPSGTITTRVGLVVGCADGAVLVTTGAGTGGADGVDFTRIPYPEAAAGGEPAAERALAFDGRKGRPTVAGIAGDTGFWLLDTRERAWSFIPTEAPLARVVAVDDGAAGAPAHVVGLGTDGRMRVFDAASGALLGATDALVRAEGAARGGTASLFVDAQRAYVNDPATGEVFEIDYADGARVARAIAPGTPAAHLAEVGR
ncbi:ABC transporter [Leucobacter allii]|uniref:ABC transporter n=1 Tax=Leucobacter allii TaxID=2932247 RepID=UPI001FD2F054|nr:ABC transporter [Leucobacter allii]UOR00822.1 ABC transporter [Leucobacter allii]